MSCCVCGRAELPSPDNEIAAQLGHPPVFERVTWRCAACKRLVCRECVVTHPTDHPPPFDRQIPDVTLCTDPDCVRSRQRSMTDIHPVGSMWHASFRVGDRIARGCIELIGGDFLGPGEHSQYFCSLDGKPFGRNDTLLDLQIAAFERYGIPIESWTRKTDPA